MRPQIVWITDGSGWGGAECDLIRVIGFLDDFAGTLVHGEQVSDEILAAAARLGISTIRIPTGNRVVNLVRGAIGAYRLVWRFPSALFVIWAHHCDSSRWVQLVLAITGCRFVVCQRSTPGSRRAFKKSRLSLPLMRVFCRYAKYVVVNGYGQRDTFHSACSIPRDRMRVIVNSRRVADIRNRVCRLRECRSQLRLKLKMGAEPAVIAVGRLSVEKDQLSLIRAAANGGRWTVYLVGDGPMGTEWLEQAKSLGAQVRFVGHQPDPLPWLAVADAFVLPSLIEGLSGALIEAMAAELPCIATDIPGNRELVIDGVTGLLVPVQSPQRLAAAITQVTDDPLLAARLSGAGFTHVATHYDEQAEGDTWRQFVQDLFDSARP